MTYDIKELLCAIDPAALDYQQWINVGMALKEGGYAPSDWDAWSARDSRRYHPGECEKKWSSFAGATQPVTMGTVVQYAREQGWRPASDEGYELDWDSQIGGHGVVVDRAWLEARELPEKTGWNPVQELTTYLETLFEASENVGYVTDSYAKDGRWIPASRGNYDRTAGQLIQELARCGGDIGSVIGDYKPDGGAWIRFNPLDGKGVKNENVTDYRYALVESDSMDLEQQHAILHEMELPIALLVHSGGKSLHAIVKVNASGYEEYRKRVNYLYDVCAKNGLKIDTQNRNPSRLSRMPGVTRKGNRQYIVARDIGKSTWDEWKEWVEAVNDNLPEPESMADAWDKLPELAPPLINGVLRMGHKLLLAGPSKAGKSYSLIELCCAVAEGKEWMGWRCAQGKVLYVNLELDRASCLHRFKDVYQALGYPPDHLSNVDIWNLRGKALPMDSLAPKLIRRASKRGYTAIIIDPIYKVITGDENSADQMANFCNQFDKVCTELGCAVIYCHHHSKGTQGNKRSMDRASGSGVFARDPDAMLDMIQLEVTDALKKSEGDRAVCKAYERAFDRYCGKDWQEQVSQDDLCSAAALKEHAARLLTRAQEREIGPELAAAREQAERRTAWRIEGTLREFAPFKPLNQWFDYPVHRPDTSGALGDLQVDGETGGPSGWKDKGRKKAIEQNKNKKGDNWQKLEMGFEALNTDGKATVSSLMEYSGLSRNAVKDWADHQPGYERDKKGVVWRVEQTDGWVSQGVNTGENDTPSV
ncbi:MAG: AAA family ATPase [Candidatus Limiplasma sp.]|nr:AAA family ATPase [Candidatus Limiplasma sp.]